MTESKQELPDEAAILAILAVIGGVDQRPRLGGVVKIEEVGYGTIAKITPRGKIHVQMHDGTLGLYRLTGMTAVRLLMIYSNFSPSYQSNIMTKLSKKYKALLKI